MQTSSEHPPDVCNPVAASSVELEHLLEKARGSDIRESVDSLCRDGTDTPYTQYKIKVFKSLEKITFKLLYAPNLHFRGFLQPTRLPKSPKSFVKVENWTAAEIPVCSCSNSGFLFFNEASSKLVQVIAVIVARKIFIFECTGPRQHNLHSDQTNFRT